MKVHGVMQAKGSSLDVKIRAHPRSALRTVRWNPPAGATATADPSSPSGMSFALLLGAKFVR